MLKILAHSRRILPLKNVGIKNYCQRPMDNMQIPCGLLWNFRRDLQTNRLNHTENKLQLSMKGLTSVHCRLISNNTSGQSDGGKLSNDVSRTGLRQLDEVEDILQYLTSRRVLTVEMMQKRRDAISELVLFLLRVDMHPNSIKQMLIHKQELLNVPLSSWRKTIQTLLDLGFSRKQLTLAVMELPAIFTGNTQNIILALTILRALGFRDGEIHTMILLHPELQNCSSKKIAKQYKKLLEIFPRAGLTTMLAATPSLLMEPMPNILAKYDYVRNKMGIEEFYMMKTNFLQHDFSHIYCRHQFLERAGLFSKPDRKGRTKTVNPTFRNIVDTDDRYFALKVAGLSREEYQAFVQLCDVEFKYGKGADSTDYDDFSDDSEDENDELDGNFDEKNDDVSDRNK